MAKVPPWRRYLRFFGADVTADVDDEVRFHLEERTEELVAQGSSPAEARRQAIAEFGDVDRVRGGLEVIGRRRERRRSRGERRSVVGLELRQAVRRLVRSPAFSLSAVLVLALGLGATVAIFQVLDSVVLRPLPYPASDQLVSLDSPVPGIGPDARWGLARHEMFYFDQHARTLADLGVYRVSQLTVGGDGDGFVAERARAALTSSTLFQVLGMRPLYGRLLLPEDNLERQPRVVVLGYGYWTRRFGGDPAIVGRSIPLEGYPQEVVGVLPAGADLPDLKVDLWSPAYVDPAAPAISNHTWLAIGRLRPGAAPADLERELAPITARFPEIFPTAYSDNFMKGSGFRTAVRPLRDVVVGPVVSRALWILLGSVALVLLIAAANVGNLFLVRVEGRRRELALRAALGASRRQLALHLLAEGLAVAAVAGGLALALAGLGVRLLIALAPSTLPRLDEVHLGPGALPLTAALALMGGVALALVPLATTRVPAAELAASGRRATAGRRRHAARGAMVVGQVALAMVLLAAAGLMLRSFRQLRGVRPGFDGDRVVVASLALPRARYGDTAFARAEAFYRAVHDRLAATPGVANVGFGEMVPLEVGDGCTGVIPEREAGRRYSEACVVTMQVSPGYFRTLGIELRGRRPDWSEVEARSGGAVVSRAFAERMWPGEDPMGKGLRCCRYGDRYYRVVGVTGDVRGSGLDRPPTEIVYFPILPLAGDLLDGVPGYMQVVVRLRAASVEPMAAELRRIVTALDPEVAIANVRPMADIVGRSVANRSFTLVLLGIAAGMALAISGIGLYGVVAYLVGERRQEIGIRLALGAGARRVGRSVMLHTMRLAAIGVAIGLVVSIGSMRLLRSLLFEVSPTDPGTLAAVAVFLVGLSALAGYLPARRAMRVDPGETLRLD